MKIPTYETIKQEFTYISRCLLSSIPHPLVQIHVTNNCAAPAEPAPDRIQIEVRRGYSDSLWIKLPSQTPGLKTGKYTIPRFW